MRVVAILALAAGASGCRRLTINGILAPCSSNENEEQCSNTCGPCVWVDSCPDRRRNLRFGAAETGCCVPLCGPARRLTAEEMAALSPEQREAHRRLC